MTRLTLLLFLLCSCGGGRPTTYVTPSGKAYECGAKLCIDITVNGIPVQAIYDSGAKGQLWLSEEFADSLELAKLRTRKLWVTESAPSFNNETYQITMRAEVEACAGDECYRVNPWSIIMPQDALWGLGL